MWNSECGAPDPGGALELQRSRPTMEAFGASGLSMNLPTSAQTSGGRRSASTRDWSVTRDINDVLWLVGDQDSSTAPDLDLALAQQGPRDVVVNMSGVTFMSASTVGALVNSRNLLRRGGYTLTLRAAPPCVLRLLDLCGLTDFLSDVSGEISKSATALSPSTDNCNAQSDNAQSNSAQSDSP